MFVTYGGPRPCWKRPLQWAALKGRAWRVKVGRRVYRVGMPRRRLPPHIRHYKGPDGGLALATMPFVGTRTPTVLAHMSHRHVNYFSIFIGGAGD